MTARAGADRVLIKSSELTRTLMKRHALPVTLLALSLQFTCAGQDWISLFDGKTLNGWQPSENKNTWRVLDGCLVPGGGGRPPLFSKRDVHNTGFKNFQLG